MFARDLHKVFFLIFIPYIAIISLGFGLFVLIQYNHDIDLIKKNEHLQLNLVRKSVIRDLQMILPDIEILVNERHIQQYLITPDETARKLAEQDIESFSRNKRLYRQIRFINTMGSEIIRVDYRDDKSVVFNKNELQNKYDRYYFTDSINLGRGELYISPMDLNIENGSIETPYVPTIRFAMPVHDDKNTVHGIIVLNYYASKLLQNFDEMLSGTSGHIALLNEDSYWLRSHKSEREWAFMFNKDIRFNQKHPEEWAQIASNDNGQIRSHDGLFTFSSVHPLKLIGGYSKDEIKEEHTAHHHTDPDSYVWKIISDVPSATLQQKLYDKIFGSLGLIWLVLIIMGIFTSWYLSLTVRERRNLRYINELHAKIYKSSTEGIIISDTDNKIIDINDAFTDICGYSREEIIGQYPSMFSSGRHDKKFYTDLINDLDANGYWEGEIYNRHKDGSIYIEWIRITAIKNRQEKISNYIALISDITHKKSTEEQLLKHAHHDPLTGAHNRLSFDERLKHDLLLAKRNNKKMALLYIDLDKFKPINDTYGHQAGDTILQCVVDRITNSIRVTDILARMGGDEFAVLLTEIEIRKDAVKVANSLRNLIKEPVQYQDIQLNIDASIGIAIYPDDADNETELVLKADKDMYKMKQQSKAM